MTVPKPLPRLKPEPIPAINPVPEYAADPELHAIYEETKRSLNVPWMGVVTMAFAHYRHFYRALWNGIHELVESKEFVNACSELRLFAEKRAMDLRPTSIVSELQAAGYADKEIDDIKVTNEVFSHGNMPYVLIATIARMLLEGHELGAKRPANKTQQPSAMVTTKLTLMEKHHADPTTVALYEDVETTLGLPFVNTDYRALCRWPSYFTHAWAGLKPAVESASYEPTVAAVHDHAVALIRSLPNPGGLTSESLRLAAENDAGVDEIRNVVRLFQWLLPGLVTNVAFCRAQLERQN